MGNCNPKDLQIIKLEYCVPDPNHQNQINDTNAKYSARHRRSFSDNNHCTKTDIQTYQSSNISSSKLIKEKPRATKRSTLFMQITDKNTSYQTKSSCDNNNNKHFASVRKKMLEIKTKGLFLPEDQSILLNSFKSHFLINRIDKASMHSLISQLNKYQFEENDDIFLEGEESNSMYLIICGSVELYKLSTKRTIVNSSKEFFGEIGILEEKSLRTYNARGLTKGYLYEITCSALMEIKAFSIRIDSQLESMIDNVPLFSYLEDSEKENLSKCTYVKCLKQNELMNFNEAFYIIKQGKIKINNEHNKTIEMEQNMFYGISNLLFDIVSQKIIAVENSELYILPLQAFIEILGIDYHYQILYPYFRKVMSNNKFFSKLFNELQLVPIYQLFSIKKYKQKAVVCPKGTSGKIMIIIKGKLICQPKNSNTVIEFKFGTVYGDQLITSGFVLDNDLIAKSNSIVLECEWEDMKAKVNSFNSSIVKTMKRLSVIEFFRNANESKLLEIASIVQKVKYKKKDLICNKDFNNDCFFLIYKGEAKLKLKNKTIKRYGKGNCFGELYVFEIEDQGTNIAASSDKLSLYSIPGEYFKNLIGDNTYNDYIKKKMCIEDREIDINDLYCIKELSKRSYIAHNSVEFYLVKAYNKTSNEFNLALRSYKAMKHLDHPFIVKYVKMIEVKHCALLIFEYIRNALSLEQLIQSKHPTTNKMAMILFYSACIILVLDYIHSKYYMHRNITPENIIIDSSGYIKLINFSLSTKPKNKSSTSSIVGFPCYASPEVLKGSNYSFGCDYWNLGIVLYYFYFNKLPFDQTQDDDPLGIYEKIIDHQLDINQCDPQLACLFNSLLEINSAKRCSSLMMAKELPCFKGFDFNEVISFKYKPLFIPPNCNDDHDTLLQSKDNSLLSLINKRSNLKGSTNKLGLWESYFN